MGGIVDEPKRDETAGESITAPDASAVQSLRITGNAAIDGAVWISAITALAYFTIYLYELGYCSHFGIPTEFIEVKLVKLAYVPAGLAIVFGLMLFLTSFLEPARAIFQFHPIFWKKLRPIILTLIFAMVAFWVTSSWMPLLFVAIIALIEFIFPLVVGKKGTTYTEKCLWLFKKESDPKNLDMRLTTAIGTKLSLVLAFLYFVTAFSFFIGVGIAKSKSNFTVIECPTCQWHQRLIVLATYGDNLVCGGIDSSNTLTPYFQLLDKQILASQMSTRMMHKNIGKLKPYTQKAADSVSVPPDVKANTTPRSYPDSAHQTDH